MTFRMFFPLFKESLLMYLREWKAGNQEKIPAWLIPFITEVVAIFQEK